MSDKVEEEAMISPDIAWRFKLGIVLFVLSIIIPVIGIPLTVSFLELSTTMMTSLTGGMLLAGEVLGLLAVAVMGKPGYNYIKIRFFSFLKQYAPPQRVGRSRYTIGLAMFCIPILFGWVSVYTSNYIPGFSENPLPYAIAGDLLFLASLVVLGGDFWDKIRALFVYDAEASFLKRQDG